MLKPTVIYERFGGKVEVRIYGKSPCSLEEKHLFQIARDLELRHIYHPQTHTFNAQICRTIDFTKEDRVDGVKIHSGALVDGVSRIGRGEAIWLQTADCPTIIAHNDLTGEVIVAHAGRASLIDQARLLTGKPSRQSESVVERIYRCLIDSERQTNLNIDVYSCCGIGPMQFRHPIDHPVHGQFNEKMNRFIALRYGQDCFLGGQVDYGALNLHRLIFNQFRLCGIPGDNIHHDSINTAVDNKYFFSRRSGDRIGHNSILVIRRS